MTTPVLASSMAEYFAEKLSGMPLFEEIGLSFVSSFLAAVVHVALLGAFFGLPAGAFIWLERKVSGRIQDRLGPTRTGGLFGWLQSLADGIKLLQKEDLAPKAADRFLFLLAPFFVVAASFAAFLFMPFADGWVASSMDVSLFLMLAVLSLEVIGVILAGYCSGSKWALYGAIREAAQMVSYEIPMAICALVPVMICGTLNLNEIVIAQSAPSVAGISLLSWNVFNPVAFFAFFVYFTCATASCKRAPFDLAEAESELVAGFLTEYSGFRWSLFFLAEYASMFAVSGLAVSLFLGGWNDGLGLIDSLGRAGSLETTILRTVLGMAVFAGKSSVLVFLQIWVRWTLPRIRIDQVMTTCLRYLVPLSCALFAAAAIYPLLLVKLTHHSRLI